MDLHYWYVALGAFIALMLPCYMVPIGDTIPDQIITVSVHYNVTQPGVNYKSTVQSTTQLGVIMKTTMHTDSYTQFFTTAYKYTPCGNTDYKIYTLYNNGFNEGTMACVMVSMHYHSIQHFIILYCRIENVKRKILYIKQMLSRNLYRQHDFVVLIGKLPLWQNTLASLIYFDALYCKDTGSIYLSLSSLVVSGGGDKIVKK